MEPSFWAARWAEGRIGFHEGRPNHHLVRHAGRLGERRRVLVPLCGKAEDLAWLAAHGHEVVGVELVEDAVRAFLAEHGLPVERTERDGFAVFRAGPVTLLAGDVFAATRAALGPVDALYDRAALIALPPELRARYTAHVRALLPPGAPGLVVTLEYEQARMPGPPFSVPEAELRGHYHGGTVELLGEAHEQGPRAREHGVTVVERAFAVTT